MALHLDNLNEEIRPYILAAIEQAEANGGVYMSTRFNAHGAEVYPSLLKDAVREHDDTWLANELHKGNVFKAVERGNAWGKPSVGRVDRTAHETLAEGEFNSFYMRGLCLYAIEHGIPELEIYRAKEVFQERSSSNAKIGDRFSPQILLADLKAPFNTRTMSGMPTGPNSGLSLRIPPQ
jgi:hypothetical protein